MKYLVLGFIGWVTFWSALYVGEPVRCNGDVYSWIVPVAMFSLVALPSFLAYFAGKWDAMGEFSEGEF